MPDRLARWIDGLVFFVVIEKKGFDPVLVYLLIFRARKVHWAPIDLKDPFFIYLWRTGKVIWMADKRMHECKSEWNGHLIYQERQIMAIEVRFKADLPTV